ncbi:MAG: PQQ-binding-like beta-propeller repeat protein [Anaerolineales bacterium]|nr:PQQ-binding-like beta-propeller repeat protein [Anaerolineales bacterium]
MKTKLSLIVLALASLALLVSGCAQGLMPSSWPGVTADAERAYVAAGPFVYAVNLNTGAEVWHFPEKASTANPFNAAPVLTVDGQLIVAGFNKVLSSLDPADGSLNWEFEGAHDRYYGSVLATESMIYAPNADYNLYALTLDGDLVWQFAAEQAIWAAPVSDGERVYFGALDRRVYALDAQTGALVWEQTLNSAILASLAFGPEGTLFVSTLNGSVFALDSRSGRTIWAQPFDAENQIWAAPVMFHDNLYIVDMAGLIYTLDPARGEESLPRLDADSAIVSAPLIANEVLVFGTEEGTMFIIDQAHNPQTVRLSGQLYGAPAVSGDLILFAPLETDDLLLAVTLEGIQRWGFSPED